MNDWDLIVELALIFEQDPDVIIAPARRRDVPPRDVIAAYTRTLRYVRIHGVDGAKQAPFTELDARPPGTIDGRVALQGEIWIDTFRQAHRISEMAPEYAIAVLGFMLRSAPWIYTVDGELDEWLDQTPLFAALRSRAQLKFDEDIKTMPFPFGPA